MHLIQISKKKSTTKSDALTTFPLRDTTVDPSTSYGSYSMGGGAVTPVLERSMNCCISDLTLIICEALDTPCYSVKS